MNLFSVKGNQEMSIDEEEIRQYLEAKPLKKNLILSDNSNDYDQGSGTAKEEKIGLKNLARAQYIQERNKKIQAGDKLSISEFMTEQTEIRQRLEEQRYKKRLEYDVMQQADKLRKQMSKITEEGRQNEKEDLERYEKQRDHDIANVYDYFNCTEEFWNKWQSDNHKPEESPANSLIGTGTVGFVCDIHRYKACIPMQDGRLATSAFTIGPIEDHIRRHDPEMHKQAIISTINEKYDKLIQERKDKTLEDKEVAFKREIRDINNIKTRPGGDYGLLNSGTKMTKGERAKIRREEESENQKNRKIYRGLYS
jgi:hypothetical protein